jgi:hypothetical protein
MHALLSSSATLVKKLLSNAFQIPVNNSELVPAEKHLPYKHTLFMNLLLAFASLWNL